jgi:hypothetical protein
MKLPGPVVAIDLGNGKHKGYPVGPREVAERKRGVCNRAAAHGHDAPWGLALEEASIRGRMTFRSSHVHLGL